MGKIPTPVRFVLFVVVAASLGQWWWRTNHQDGARIRWTEQRVYCEAMFCGRCEAPCTNAVRSVACYSGIGNDVFGKRGEQEHCWPSLLDCEAKRADFGDRYDDISDCYILRHRD